MYSLFQILMLILDVARWIIIAHILFSWLISFQVLNPRQPLVGQIWYGLNNILEPIYSRVRSMLPHIGGIDIAPLVVLLIIIGIRIVLINNVALFY